MGRDSATFWDKGSEVSSLPRGVFCQFPFRWIYYYGRNESTGKKTGKTYLCALLRLFEKRTHALDFKLQNLCYQTLQSAIRGAHTSILMGGATNPRLKSDRIYLRIECLKKKLVAQQSKGFSGQDFFHGQ